MSRGSTIEEFARMSKLPVEEVLEKLKEAGITGKKPQDVLAEEEKTRFLEHIGGGRKQITVKRRETGAYRQTSKTGAAHTIHVETRKGRTFVKRSELEGAGEEESKPLPEPVPARKAAPAAPAAEAPEEPETVEAAPAEAEAAEAAEIPPEPPQAEAEALEAEEFEAPESLDEAEPSADVEAPARAKKPAADKKAKPAPASEQERRARKKKGRKGGRPGDDELHAAERLRKPGYRPRKPANLSRLMPEQHGFARPTAPIVRDVPIPSVISVADLAQSMSVKSNEVVKTLMNMGSMANVNQMLDQETAMLVVSELGHKPLAADEPEPEAELRVEDDAYPRVRRDPVVTVLGHVDHGKTTLLDKLRDARVAAGEVGGITQHIGAYKVRLKQGGICFLDTPGHAAFSAIRARGAQGADIAILVVAADDGVMPQTVEAINHAKAAEVPIVVALNKMDRPDADPDKIKQQLLEHNVISEEFGGEILLVPVSAQTGEGLDKLLEAVSLQAEMAELTARTEGPAHGIVIEARLDRGRGPVATVLVQEGTLHRGDIILAGRETGRVRAMTDDAGKTLKSAGPSTPVEIQGLSGVPEAGDDVLVAGDERKARAIAMERQTQHKERAFAKRQKNNLTAFFNLEEEGGAVAAEQKTLNLVIKADAHGSLEALTDSLVKLSSDEVEVRVLHGAVGGINESDVTLASTTQAMVIGFNVRAETQARKLLEQEGVQAFYHNIIYNCIDAVKDILSGMHQPKIFERQVGLAEVRDVFRASKVGAVAGCLVVEGSVRRELPVRVLRDNVVIFEGVLESLRRFKDPVAEVQSGVECGIGIKNYNDIKPGDQIEVYSVESEAAAP